MSADHHERWRDEVAAYALGSLDPARIAEFESHLARCAQCRRELDWYTPAVESLAESVERVEPPATLRAALVETVRGEAPAAEATGESTSARRARARSGGRFSGSFFLRPAIGLAAIALVVAVAAIAYSAGGGGEGASTVTTRSASGGVQASLERSGDGGVLELAGLSQLPPGRVYEAWVQRGGGFEPSSLFAARRDGTASAAIPADLDGARNVLVTVEPQGGSQAPTTTPLLSVPVGS